MEGVSVSEWKKKFIFEPYTLTIFNMEDDEWEKYIIVKLLMSTWTFRYKTFITALAVFFIFFPFFNGGNTYSCCKVAPDQETIRDDFISCQTTLFSANHSWNLYLIIFTTWANNSRTLVKMTNRMSNECMANPQWSNWPTIASNGEFKNNSKSPFTMRPTVAKSGDSIRNTTSRL